MAQTKQTIVAAAALFLQAHAQDACVCDTLYDPVHVWLPMERDMPACVTYPNACRALCEGKNDARKGRCPIPGEPIEGCASTKEYFPVCGYNGVTYSNPSVAECHQIYDVTDGACEDEKPAPAPEGDDDTGNYIDGCTHIQTYDPVCGSNGVTYTNSGEAACYGVTEYEEGACMRCKKRGKGGKGKGGKGKGGKGKGGKGGKDDSDEPETQDEPNCDMCPTSYEPLVAIDYTTETMECLQFNNECEAWCNEPPIPEADKRGTDRDDGRYWLADGVCPKPGEYIPGCVWLVPWFDWVCGIENNVTYQNPSEAHCNGIFKYTKGRCEGDELLAPDFGM